MGEVYEFDNWEEYHFAMGSRIKLSKKTVWDALKYDKDFLSLKLYEIRYEDTDNARTSPTSPYWSDLKMFNTGRFWAKNLREAKKIGEVIKQVYPATPPINKSKEVK